MVSEKKTKNIIFMKVSELADFKPVVQIHTEDEDLERIEKSIKERGVLVPIVVNLSGKLIIDGYTRLKIAQKLNIEEVLVEIIDDDTDSKEQETLSIDLNLARRHLDRNTKVALIEKLLGMYNEIKRSHSTKHPHEGVAGTIARQVGVSPTTVKKVQVLTSNKDLLEKVKANEISLEAAYQEVKAARQAQKETFDQIRQQEKKEKEALELFELKQLREIYAKMKEIIFTRQGAIAYTETATIVLLAIKILETIISVYDYLPKPDVEKITNEIDRLTQQWQEIRNKINREELV